MPLSSRLSLSLASTAAVALASLPLGVTPASAAKVAEGTTSSIGVVEASSNASQFNLGSLGAQGESTVLVATRGRAVGQSTPGGGVLLKEKLWEILRASFLCSIFQCDSTPPGPSGM